MDFSNRKQMEGCVWELHNPSIEAIAILDRDGVILWTSPSINDLLGFQSVELEGIEIFELLFWRSTQNVKSHFQEFQNHEQMLNGGLKQFRNKKGERVALFVSLVNLLSHPVINGIMLNLRLLKVDKKANNSSWLQLEAEIEKKVYKKVLHDIAAELHDNIGSTLVGVSLIFEYALKNPTRYFADLKKVSETLGTLIRDVRNISHGITMESPESFALYERLDILLENFRKLKTLRIILRYQHQLEEALDYEQKIQIFRILQEQLINIIKHADATKVLISLQLVNGKIKMTTRDNGKGFNIRINQAGIGLSNMLFRVNKLGGHLQINSEPGAGTIIWVVFYIN